MNIGIAAPLPAYTLSAAFMAEEVERLNFESLWYAEHPIMPVHTTSRFPNTSDGSIPWTYSHFVDPFIALAQASGASTSIKLGTGIALIPERNPLVLAKEISTLDLFSGGRFLFGIGTGWHREETAIMGGDFDHRWTQAREAIMVMRELWSKEEAEYHGRYYDFPLVRSFPKPVQKPHPPVLLGGMAPNVLRRVVEWADGWLPNRVTPAQIEESRVILDSLACQHGRIPSSITISIHGQGPDFQLAKEFHDAGANRVIVRPRHMATEKDMSEELERIAEAVLR